MAVTVRLLQPINGEAMAQILEGSAAHKRRPLREFNQKVRDRFVGEPPGAILKCLDNLAPTPENVVPVPLQPPEPSEFDDNPYNFAAWEGTTPFLPEAGHDGATHERWHAGRHSGRLHVRLEAVTPVFVPEGTFLDSADRETPRWFWSCPHPDDAIGTVRYGIPGSTIKGVVRTLFETWTNSLLTAISPKHYEEHIPYRRRSATPMVVKAVHHNGDIELLRCEADGLSPFAHWSPGGWRRRGAVGQPGMQVWNPPGEVAFPDGTAAVPGDFVDPANTAQYQAVRFRANLLWTPQHKHGRYNRLVVKVTTAPAVRVAGGAERYRNGLKHPFFHPTEGHPHYVMTGPNDSHYTNIPDKETGGPCTEPVDARLEEMRDLRPGSIVFVVPGAASTAPVAFGRNVNFTWPALRTPLALLAGFAPPADAEERLWDEANGARDTVADLARATFGFAGSQAEGAVGHPFRARVRFGTFWAAAEAMPAPNAVSLGPLTAPSGSKLKARTVYLPRGRDQRYQTYDEATTLRGRKFYWHQRWTQGLVAYDHTAAAHPDQSSQCPPPIHVMPQGSTFDGIVDFDNLTNLEIGALLVSLDPRLFFGHEAGDFGIKLGKGKPRGLGSVRTKISVRVRRSPADCYESLAASALPPEAKEDGARFCEAAVQAFKDWLGTKSGGGAASTLGFVRDLEQLLRLPSTTSLRKYHAPGYDGMPGFGNADGDPQSGRPLAMQPARDLEVT